MEYLHRYYLELIRGKRKGPVPSLVRGILYLFSFVFQGAVALRTMAYERGWCKRNRAPVPLVISIGNIVVGGSGKTPATLLLAQAFYPETPIAILSRGYRSQTERLAHPLILSQGSGPLYPPEYCGDEPYMLSRRLPKAWVITGKDRSAAAVLAAEAGVKLVILDDGMQHRRLERDLEIVVVHAGDPFGEGYFLPRGLLREGPEALARADLIVVHHTRDETHYTEMCQQVAPYSSAPVVGTHLAITHVWDAQGELVHNVADMCVGVFCGVAYPESFQQTIRKLGAVPVLEHFFPDHRTFDAKGLARFATECRSRGAKMLLCTEKDFVKLNRSLDLALPLAWVDTRMKIVAGHEHWTAFLEKAKDKLHHHASDVSPYACRS